MFTVSGIILTVFIALHAGHRLAKSSGRLGLLDAMVRRRTKVN